MKLNRPGFTRAGLLCAALLIVSCASVAGQGLTTGALRGTMLEPSGMPVGEVLVTLTDSAGGVRRTMFSDRDGVWRFGFLPPGEYDVLLEKLGFVPRSIAGVPVRPGRELSLELELEPTTSPTPARSAEVYSGAAQRGGLPGAAQWIEESRVRGAPYRRETLDELLRLTSFGGAGAGIDGLPAWLSVAAVDGVGFRPAGGSQLPDAGAAGAALAGSALALNGIGPARIALHVPDVEWSGAAGALLSAQTRMGGADRAVDAEATWSGDVLPGGSFSGDVDSFHDVQARVAAQGPLMGDSSSFGVGIEIRRTREARSAAWPADDAVASVLALAEARGVDLSAWPRAALAHDDAVSAYAALGLPLAGNHELRISAHGALRSAIPVHDPATGLESEYEGHDAVGSASVLSSFGARTANELRVGVTSSVRQATDDPLSPVFLATGSLAFGSLHPFDRAAVRTVTVTDALHFRSGAHALKAGAGIGSSAHEIARRPGADAARFYFGSVGELAAESGVFVGTEGGAARADWSGATYSLFAQDVWSGARGLEIRLGVRADRVPLPVGNVRRDAEWFRLSGLANDDTPSGVWVVSPRVGVTWDPTGEQSWIVHAAGGVYHDEPDPLLLAEWQTDAGGARVNRAIGSMLWPDEPAAGSNARRLTMLAPSFAPPRTTRLTAGVARSLDERTAVRVSAAVRRTANLPRRSDLNTLPLPAFHDQYDRPVYGVLAMQGALLAQEPGTGRRFDEYDEVAAISSDGESDHWGITLGVDRQLGSGLDLLARYTFARTNDNWFGAAAGGWTTGLSEDMRNEWADGTSDFDVPHRLAAALTYRPADAVELAAVYNLRSGLPFTPGFRPGVDANADGVPGNDPAFVDPDLAGMDALMRDWPCLRDDAGDFASRNGCRTDAVHTFDLRAAVTVLRFSGATAAIQLEAFDLLESAQDVPDAALYLVDAAAPLVTDTDARTVTVPLLVNDAFGTPLTRRHAGRMIRLGISLNW